ncbi:hypothetical protein K2X33_05185 [bacterium]|nr:hypothetical protein [bacterium]
MLLSAGLVLTLAVLVQWRKKTWGFPTALTAAGLLSAFALWQWYEPSSERLKDPTWLFPWFRQTAHTSGWLFVICFAFLGGLVALGYGAKSAEEKEVRAQTLLRCCLGAFLLTSGNHFLLIGLGWFLCIKPWSRAIQATLPTSKQQVYFQATFIGEWIVLSLLFIALVLLGLQYGTLNLVDLGDRIRSDAAAPDFWLYVSMALLVCSVGTHLAVLPFQVLSATRIRESENGLQAFSALFMFLSTCGFAWNLFGRTLAEPLKQWEGFLFILGMVSIVGGGCWLLVVRRTNELLLASLTILGGWLLLLWTEIEHLDTEAIALFLVSSHATAYVAVLFGMVLLEKNGGRDGGALKQGWVWNRPFLGFAVLSGIASLADLPPLWGFASKLALATQMGPAIGLASVFLVLGASALAAYSWLRHASPWIAAPSPLPWVEPVTWQAILFVTLAVVLWVVGLVPLSAWTG